MIARPSFGGRKSEKRKTEQHEVHWDLTGATPFYEADLSQARTETERQSSKGTTVEGMYDVCIICALADEGRTFMQITEQQCIVQFEKAFEQRLGLVYYHTRILNDQGEQLTLQVSWPAKYGPQEMELHLKPLFAAFRPCFAAMTGICAGDKERVKLGDLVVAERAYFYESGKIILGQNGKRVRLSDIDLYSASSKVKNFIQTFEYERFLRTLDHWKSIVTHHNPAYHIGTMASGSAVRADHPFDEASFPVRNTLAIDMEGAAFYRAAMDFPGMHALLAKGVSDFADSNKNDAYRQYSSAISAMYMLSFIKEYVTSDRMSRIY
jgi:nucleoside phosphorylase